jgi:hypothetical protein
VTPAGLRRHQLGEGVYLWTAQIRREHILAYFMAPGEFEVLVDPALVPQREKIPFRPSALGTPPLCGALLLQGDIARAVRCAGAQRDLI